MKQAPFGANCQAVFYRKMWGLRVHRERCSCFLSQPWGHCLSWGRFIIHGNTEGLQRVKSSSGENCRVLVHTFSRSSEWHLTLTHFNRSIVHFELAIMTMHVFNKLKELIACETNGLQRIVEVLRQVEVFLYRRTAVNVSVSLKWDPTIPLC